VRPSQSFEYHKPYELQKVGEKNVYDRNRFSCISFIDFSKKICKFSPPNGEGPVGMEMWSFYKVKTR